jgi:LPXTG-site transpeptidase (sortase) family protein
MSGSTKIDLAQDAAVPRRTERRLHAERQRGWPRRRVLRWVANLLIIGGVCLLAYPLSTWGYTWYEQGKLRDRLNQSNPQIAVAAAALDSSDMVRVGPGGGTGGTGGTGGADNGGGANGSTTPGATGAGATGDGNAAQNAADAERAAQLAAFKAAADSFETGSVHKAGEPLGRILVPSIGVDKVIIEGTGTGDLREGPGHWPETPFPGQGGNFVISGHRTTYGAPFLKLNKVQVGDEIDVVLPYAVVEYMVTRTMIVDPKDVESVAQVGKEQISLAACHPIYSAKQRIVVQGDLVAFKLIQQ